MARKPGWGGIIYMSPLRPRRRAPWQPPAGASRGCGAPGPGRPEACCRRGRTRRARPPRKSCRLRPQGNGRPG
eukprot:scaffold168302_cov35-Prasinocladus_malaysianus.AAC.2